MCPIRVLFVDDDVNILRSLRRNLRGARDQLAVRFAEGGEAGLAELDKETADVVVSDMRMPGMDGATFLKKVQERHPATIRMILSGYSDEEAVIKTVGPAHQFLSKPCNSEDLLRAIHRSSDLRNMIQSPELQKTISGLENLPSPPTTYINLMEDLASPHSNNQSITRILETDVAMTAATLKLVNSAFFAQPQQVTDLSRAVQLLGIETLRALALGVGLYRASSEKPVVSAEVAKLSQRSIYMGQLAARIAHTEKMDPGIQDQAMSAGVLSHLGSLVLLSERTDAYFEALEMMACRDLTLIEAERRLCGASHPEVGAYLLSLWGFSDPMVEAVFCHHEVERLQEDLPPITRALYGAALIAGLSDVARERGLSEPLLESFDELISKRDRERLNRFGLSETLISWLIATETLQTQWLSA